MVPLMSLIAISPHPIGRVLGRAWLGGLGSSWSGSGRPWPEWSEELGPGGSERPWSGLYGHLAPLSSLAQGLLWAPELQNFQSVFLQAELNPCQGCWREAQREEEPRLHLTCLLGFGGQISLYTLELVCVAWGSTTHTQHKAGATQCWALLGQPPLGPLGRAGLPFPRVLPRLLAPPYLEAATGRG